VVCRRTPSSRSSGWSKRCSSAVIRPPQPGSWRSSTTCCRSDSCGLRRESAAHSPAGADHSLPLARAVEFWGFHAEAVSVVHDEQSALTHDRLGDIAAAYAAGHPGRRLAGVRLVDSKTDPLVQVADVLAGIAPPSAGSARRLWRRVHSPAPTVRRPAVDLGRLAQLGGAVSWTSLTRPAKLVPSERFVGRETTRSVSERSSASRRVR
jgi:hypothetical protein